MAQYTKEIGLLWAFCVSWVLINASDERGRSVIISQGSHQFGSSGSSGSSVMNIQSIGTYSNVNTLVLDYFQGCERYTEYNDLIHLENNQECYSMASVFTKLRALHERNHIHGPGCMHDVIGKLKTYFTTYHNSRCKCDGHVVYHPERYHNVHPTCKNQNNHFNDVYDHLFGYYSNHVHCIPHDRAFIQLGSLPTNLNNYLDCQWEIINHYTTITDVNGIICSCFQEPMNAHITPNHTVSTTTISLTTSENKPMSEHTIPHSTHSTSTAISPTPTFTESHTCTKADVISTLGYGIKQTNPLAGNCHSETFDHMAPEALVMNMCNVTGHSETWTRGQNVMSICERIPLYTPVATFFDGKYSSQGGLAGIFIGCLQGGFKMIVQECDKNITVMHVVTGGHFHLDPLNYSIIM